MKSLTHMAANILKTANVQTKIKLSKEYSDMWFDDRKNFNRISIGNAACPDIPSKPNKPELLPPRSMPKRKIGTESGKIALIHSVAHIEFNAIDLH